MAVIGGRTAGVTRRGRLEREERSGLTAAWGGQVCKRCLEAGAATNWPGVKLWEETRANDVPRVKWTQVNKQRTERWGLGAQSLSFLPLGRGLKQSPISPRDPQSSPVWVSVWRSLWRRKQQACASKRVDLHCQHVCGFQPVLARRSLNQERGWLLGKLSSCPDPAAPRARMKGTSALHKVRNNKWFKNSQASKKVSLRRLQNRVSKASIEKIACHQRQLRCWLDGQDPGPRPEWFQRAEIKARKAAFLASPADYSKAH